VSRKKKAPYFVAAFVIAFVALLAYEAKASTAVEIVPGFSFVGSERYRGSGIALNERFSGKYDIGLMLMSGQDCVGCRRGDYGGNMGVQAQRIVHWRGVELGLGVAYWANQTPAWNSNMTFSLSAGYHFGPVEFRWRHYSTGGSSEWNSGLDLITIGWRF
jgi:hypothetical protein